MFEQYGMAAFDVTKETMHSQMEFRIVAFHRCYKFLNFNSGFKFFQNLSLQGFFWSFSRFNLSTRKLPPVLHVTIPTLCCENTALLIMNNCCNNLYLFHLV